MNITYKGKVTDSIDLPQSLLPKNAVKFKEPTNSFSSNLCGILCIIPMFLLMNIIVEYFLNVSLLDIRFNIYGLVLAFLMMLPHEYLHGICFPRNAQVNIYYLSKFIAFATSCIEPISKKRYIWMNLCPNLFLGFIPFILWLFFFNDMPIGNTIFTFSLICTSFGAMDYVNIINAIIQMPVKSYQQLSGIHSYWFK